MMTTRLPMSASETWRRTCEFCDRATARHGRWFGGESTNATNSALSVWISASGPLGSGAKAAGEPLGPPHSILFERYAQAGFLYQAKRERLRPFMPQILDGWGRAPASVMTDAGPARRAP
jgi:hypothetical protein